ncbi:KpsF/GutQ family sugar-phosphate isomerase [Gluconacetobacter azotocaptans]|uniref:KpsF/GutQ family sugar-phosphate isomerase n=1 Tax=Gluconacetobacter azotocaptans TaxID=142834 RepID=A0A7W4PCY4_9PROT|nr:KpsF/GutQ family sugar-phosphate isomerase [Gluconacetobacter azotocaptans]MBB2189732.1 KpsF/GutQ family sugar-phosphate isomerase [Gluconacetobacter azotocaptans]MBM9401321.1 KpsF/GutQ family sugar-phosphate isomerase [Gluconacetobacter azotocaptans]GBQ29919.1 arabinose-5-phosphate isomerase GutQ [Gluconacetobacter azotocaptans DSM 13594]
MTHSAFPDGIAGPAPGRDRSPSDIDAACRVLASESDGLSRMAAALRAAGAEGNRPALGTAFLRVVEAFSALTGRVVVTGIGKSGHVGRKIQSTLASTGTPSVFVHPSEASHGDLGMIQPGDAILALSNSGETPELADVVAHARRFGLLLTAITAQADSTLALAADIALVMPQAPEACPMGLAPTTSSTMQMALGDALAVVLLERRRFTATDFGIFHPGGRLGARLRRVGDLMHRGAAMPIGTPDITLRQVIMEMTRKAFGCMGVVGPDGQLCGLITDGDLRRALDRNLERTYAADIMNLSPLTTGPDALAADALRLMNARARPITSLFVLDQSGMPIGILHIHDLLRAGVA